MSQMQTALSFIEEVNRNFVARRRRVVYLTALFAIFLLDTALGQGVSESPVLERYVAYLGREDEYNSLGRRLHYLHEVIEQDRANVHDFDKSQPGDEVDSIFGEYSARRRLSSAILNSGATRFLEGGIGEDKFFVVTVLGRDDDAFDVIVEEEDPIAERQRSRACTINEIEEGQCDGITF